MESKSERNIKFEAWLETVCQDLTSCTPITGDASTRRYFRLITPKLSYIVMDAPPPEKCQPFVAIAAGLRGIGLHTPDVFAAEMEQGFLLLSDFGDTTYLRAMTADPSIELADDLYKRALRSLHIMQACRSIPQYTLPSFGRVWMEREWAWHQEWFLQKWLGLSPALSPPVHHCYESLIVAALTQPQVFMHRDFHSANLMVLPNDTVGILDFQDAFIGPIAYDVVSLLRDCYIDWPAEKVREWTHYYADLLAVPHDTFTHWFDWMGLQRHLKALMTFARKAVRDDDKRYLQYIPRTLNYIITTSGKYKELSALHRYYADHVREAVNNMELVCER